MKKTFSIKKLFQESIADFKSNWKLFIFIGIIFFAAEMVGYSGLSIDPYTGIVTQSSAITIIAALLQMFIGLGFIKFLLNIVDGKEHKIEDVLRGPRNLYHFIYFAVVTFVYGALIGFGSLFFLIPGIFLAIVFLFSQYLIAEEKEDILGSFTQSWKMTSGNRWKIFWLMILLVVFNIAGFFAFIIGLVVTIPVTYIIYARLYRLLELHDSQEENKEIIEVEEVMEGDQSSEELE